MLHPSGLLVIDVGDIPGNAELVRAARTRAKLEWALRLIYCHSRDRWDSHRWGYTPDHLAELMAEWGFAHAWTPP